MEAISRTCRWVCHRLPLFVGGDLAVSERRRVERHLIGCSACRERRDASKQTLTVLQGVAALGPVGFGSKMDGAPPSVWPALARQIRESRHRPERFSAWDRVRSLGFWNLPPLVGFGLAVAGLALGIGWVSWSGRLPLIEGAQPTTPTTNMATFDAEPVASPRPVDPASLFTSHNQTVGVLDDFEVPGVRIDRRSSALPDGDASRRLTTSKPGSDPFQPPLSLRLDYDLDWGTLSPPVSQDTQRAY